jgi:hypothetical protein
MPPDQPGGYGVTGVTVTLYLTPQLAIRYGRMLID